MPSTGAPRAWKASASRAATWTASYAASAACGTSTRPARYPLSSVSAPGWPSTSPSLAPATIVHGDYRLGNTMFAAEAPARLVAVFDWEMATIGDPLADLGYMCMFWTEAYDPEGGLREHLGKVTRAEGFSTRAELIARYEEASGRSMKDLRWYTTLAIWKSIVFMEGNYKRAVAGTTDDPYLKQFGEGVLELARQGADGAWLLRVSRQRRARPGLLIDWGGVLTTNLFTSFHEYCIRMEIDPAELGKRFSADPQFRELLISLEKGAIEEGEFEESFAELLGVDSDGLIDGLFAGVQPEPRWSMPLGPRAKRASARRSSPTRGACTATLTTCSRNCSTASSSRGSRKHASRPSACMNSEPSGRAGSRAVRVRGRPALQPDARPRAGHGHGASHSAETHDPRA